MTLCLIATPSLTPWEHLHCLPSHMNRKRNTTISKGRGLAQVNETSVLGEAKRQLGNQSMDWGAKHSGTAVGLRPGIIGSAYSADEPEAKSGGMQLANLRLWLSFLR